MEHFTLIKDSKSQVTKYLKKVVAKKRLIMERDAKGKPSGSSSSSAAASSHIGLDLVHQNGSEGSVGAQVRPREGGRVYFILTMLGSKSPNSALDECVLDANP